MVWATSSGFLQKVHKHDALLHDHNHAYWGALPRPSTDWELSVQNIIQRIRVSQRRYEEQHERKQKKEIDFYRSVLLGNLKEKKKGKGKGKKKEKEKERKGKAKK